MCDAIASSREHCPPRSIFPIGHRDQLDSVPSCNTHNTSKSKIKDDEYLKCMLLTAPGSKTDTTERVESLIRSFQYNRHLVKTFMPNLRYAKFKGKDTSSFSLDKERFERIIGMVVRALYFKDNNEKLDSEFRIAWAHLGYPNSGRMPFLKGMEHIESYFGDIPDRKNGQIFQYDWKTAPNKTLNVCRLRFYQGSPIYAIW
jgi:hypothetical protein